MASKTHGRNPSKGGYIYLEETQKAMANLVKKQAKKKPTPQHEERQRKEARAPRVGRYHDYTPFKVSLADLYKEVGQVEKFPKPKALQVRANTNRSLFYKYRNGFGHKTKDCYDLRDAVEQLIQEGRLARHIASQRSLRKRRASPMKDDERRNP